MESETQTSVSGISKGNSGVKKTDIFSPRQWPAVLVLQKSQAVGL